MIEQMESCTPVSNPTAFYVHIWNMRLSWRWN